MIELRHWEDRSLKGGINLIRTFTEKIGETKVKTERG